VVLGLASTKTSRLETREKLTERIREAALADLTPVLAAPEFKVPFCSARSA